MDYLKTLWNDIVLWIEQHPYIDAPANFLFILLIAYAAYLITKKIILRAIKYFVHRTETKVDDLILSEKIIRRISLLIPFLVVNELSSLLPAIQEGLERFASALIVLFVTLIITAVLSALNDLYRLNPKFRDRPIKGYVQIVNIILFFWAGIIIAGMFTGENPWNLIASLGAITTVIILIFRDTILSFVASVQITSYDLVKEGDWIEMPSFGADGDVIDISLNVIKVQNWDKTITTIPTYKLLENSFKNWRGMQQTGGRRIMRSLSIDMSTIKFIDEELLERLKKVRLLESYLDKRLKEIQKFNEEKGINKEHILGNGRMLSNIGTFRIYIQEYLKSRQDIHPNIIMMVRQLEPGPNGLPLQLYCFARTTSWIPYEQIQADIFDHLFSVVDLFDLRLFQNPSGNDFRALSVLASNEGNNQKSIEVKNDSPEKGSYDD